jgi:DNA-binding XRE family transcriptional regulator
VRPQPFGVNPTNKVPHAKAAQSGFLGGKFPLIAAIISLNLTAREEYMLRTRLICAFFPSGKVSVIEDARQFGSAVASARKALGLTQRELALAINSGERFIVELEAGKPTAQLGKALAAAKAVGLRLAATGGPGT